jgi:hypothetical protein
VIVHSPRATFSKRASRHLVDEADGFQLVDGRLELLLDLGRRIVLTQADMPECERPEVEGPFAARVEALIKESIHLFRDGTLEREVGLEVEPLQVAGLAAPEEDLVPGELRGEELRLTSALERLPHRLLDDDHALEDVEGRVDARLDLVVPPGLIIAKGDSDPAVKRVIQPLVVGPAVRPPEELHELIPGEIHRGVGEVVPDLRELDEADDDVGIGRGRESIVVAPRDDELPGPGLELDGLEVGRDPVGEERDRELGQVHLVPPDQSGEFADVLAFRGASAFHVWSSTSKRSNNTRPVVVSYQGYNKRLRLRKASSVNGLNAETIPRNTVVRPETIPRNTVNHPSKYGSSIPRNTVVRHKPSPGMR